MWKQEQVGHNGSYIAILLLLLSLSLLLLWKAWTQESFQNYRLSLIVRVNVSWIGLVLLLLKVTDVSTTFAVVVFRVKVSCIIIIIIIIISCGHTTDFLPR